MNTILMKELYKVEDYFCPEYFTWFRYGNEALLTNERSGIDHMDCMDSNSMCHQNGQVIPETLSFSEDDFTMDICSLCGLVVGVQFFANLALLVRTPCSD
ncbi:Protein white [Gryllus bimaculatus]|nr:Protein white [Gryllus bimaculatus]